VRILEVVGDASLGFAELPAATVQAELVKK
jgi:hypothetical protein